MAAFSFSTVLHPLLQDLFYRFEETNKTLNKLHSGYNAIDVSH